MSVLEWVFIVGLAATFLFFIFGFYFFILFLSSRSKESALKKKKLKNKKKKKKNRIKLKKIIKQKSSRFKTFITLFILAFFFLGGSVYLKYYQSLSLSKDDSDSIVKSYFLIRDFEGQIEKAKNESDDAENIQKNIRYLSTTMASYGTLSASPLNTEEGQLALNRYYNSIKQLGVNASINYTNFYGNQKLCDEYLEDIKNVEKYEKIVFDYYKVSEAEFKEE